MKLLVVPSNTDLNRGDQALVWESINIIKDAVKVENIYLNITGSTQEEVEAQKQQTQNLGYSFTPRILQHPGRGTKQTEVRYGVVTYLRWGWVAAWDLFSTSLLISKFSLLNKVGEWMLCEQQKDALKLFKKMDVILVKGGGFLHSYGNLTDAYIAYFQLFEVFLGARYKKKILIMPNSFGPFKNRLARKIILSGLKKCQLLTTREIVSQHLLEENGIESSQFPDLGFYLKPSERSFKEYLIEKGFEPNGKNVAVTLRPYRFDGNSNAAQLYEQYISEVTKAISILIGKGYKVSFIAHTLGPSSHENDSIALEDVMSRLSEQELSHTLYILESNFTCRDIEKIYSYYDFIIGTRFHSVIFSLNVNTPAIAIGYGGNKSQGIMTDIGLQAYQIPIEKVNALDIINMSETLLENKKDYIDKLDNFKSQLVKERAKLVGVCKGVIG